MIEPKLEDQIAMQTEAGREGLEVLRRVKDSMTDQQRLMKAFELTETTRQLMRAGIKQDHPGASPEEIQEIYVTQLLGFQGISLSEVRKAQAEQRKRANGN